jgi:hypothetical protein
VNRFCNLPPPPPHQCHPMPSTNFDPISTTKGQHNSVITGYGTQLWSANSDMLWSHPAARLALGSTVCSPVGTETSFLGWTRRCVKLFSHLQSTHTFMMWASLSTRTNEPCDPECYDESVWMLWPDNGPIRRGTQKCILHRCVLVASAITFKRIRQGWPHFVQRGNH